MKRMLSVMLGLSLALAMSAFAADEKPAAPADTKPAAGDTEKKPKKAKAKKAEEKKAEATK